MFVRFFALLLVVVFLSGCQTGSSTVPLAPTGFRPVDTGSVVVNTTVASRLASRISLQVVAIESAEIPAEIQEARFTGLDAANQKVFGPVSLPVSSTLTLNGVPVTVAKLQIELLEAGFVVGGLSIPVSIRAGQTTTIEQPRFVYCCSNWMIEV